MKSTYTVPGTGDPLMDSAEIDGVQYRWFSIFHFLTAYKQAVPNDTRYILIAMVLVFVALVVHTKSVFIGSMSIAQILLSIPYSAIWYVLGLRVTYFAAIHTAALFMIIGIGADDVFVYVDAYSQARRLVKQIKLRELAMRTRRTRNDYADVDIAEVTLNRDDLKLILYYAFLRTKNAVAATSFTTAFAFICMAVSPIMPLSAFGYFLAVLVVMNYVFALTITSAVLIVNEVHFSAADHVMHCCC